MDTTQKILLIGGSGYIGSFLKNTISSSTITVLLFKLILIVLCNRLVLLNF